MKANAKTAIVHPDVVLVPYRREHVAKYHDWMTCAELRELTASEPLTLEEEYEMQRQWQTDEDKLTFIVLAGPAVASAIDGGDAKEKKMHADDHEDGQDQHRSKDVANAKFVPAGLSLQELPMIGDVNLFLKGTPDEDDFEVEVEVMIAEPSYRHRGLAQTALQLLLSYATASPSPCSPDLSLAPPPAPLPLPRSRLLARIGERNIASVRLFEKLGFVVTKRVEVFQELELRFVDTSKAQEWERGELRELDDGENEDRDG